MPAAQRFPAPLTRPVLRSQKSEHGEQNVDFYQLFALAPCFSLFIIDIKLFLALGTVSKTLSKGTRLHKPSRHCVTAACQDMFPLRGCTAEKPFISEISCLTCVAIQDLFRSC